MCKQMNNYMNKTIRVAFWPPVDAYYIHIYAHALFFALNLGWRPTLAVEAANA